MTEAPTEPLLWAGDGARGPRPPVARGRPCVSAISAAWLGGAVPAPPVPWGDPDAGRPRPGRTGGFRVAEPAPSSGGRAPQAMASRGPLLRRVLGAGAGPRRPGAVRVSRGPQACACWLLVAPSPLRALWGPLRRAPVPPTLRPHPPSGPAPWCHHLGTSVSACGLWGPAGHPPCTPRLPGGGRLLQPPQQQDPQLGLRQGPAARVPGFTLPCLVTSGQEAEESDRVPPEVCVIMPPGPQAW